MSTLIFSLDPNAEDGVFHYVTSNDGRTLLQQGSATLGLMPSCDRWVAVLPVRAVSWHVLSLPKVPSKHARAALEGLLEDAVLDDPAQLHFALPPKGVLSPAAPAGAAGGSLDFVAACDRLWLKKQLEVIQAALGSKPYRIVPAMVPQEGEQQQLVPHEDESIWLYVANPSGVLAWPLAHLPDSLKHSSSPVYASPATAQAGQAVLGDRVRVQSASDFLLAAMQTPWDLAQFDLAPAKGLAALFGGTKLTGAWQQLRYGPHWRLLRYGLLALLLSNVIGLNAFAWYEKKQVQNKQLTTVKILQETFPQVQAMPGQAALQMEREMRNLGLGGDGAAPKTEGPPMLELLQGLQKIAPQRHLMGIEFTGKTLFVPELHLEQLEIEALQAAGYIVTVQGNGVSIALKP